MLQISLKNAFFCHVFTWSDFFYYYDYFWVNFIQPCLKWSQGPQWLLICCVKKLNLEKWKNFKILWCEYNNYFQNCQRFLHISILWQKLLPTLQKIYFSTLLCIIRYIFMTFSPLFVEWSLFWKNFRTWLLGHFYSRGLLALFVGRFWPNLC